MNGRTLATIALVLARSGCSRLSSEDEAPPAAATPEPVTEAVDDDHDEGGDPRALPVGQPVPMPMAPAAPTEEGAAGDRGPDRVYDIEE